MHEMTWNLKLRQLEAYGFGPNVMKKTKVCRKCGKLIQRHALFCYGCGAWLPRETLFDLYSRRHKTCTFCRTILTVDAKYCPHCGERIKLS